MSYPRVLLLHMTKVYAKDGANLLVRNLFGEWPIENLAQVYTSSYQGQGDFCGHYYKIGPQDRRLGHFFQILKPTGINAISGQSTGTNRTPSQVMGGRVLMKKFVSAWIALGLWEVIFRIHLSNTLSQFISDFKPAILYTQGYSLGFVALTLTIAQRFGIPICYFPVDDWHSSLYQNSPIHSEVRKLAIQIAKHASHRFSLGPKMTQELSKRYHVPFECLYNADDFARFARTTSHKRSVHQPLIIGYTGSLYLGRTSSLLDLLEACYLLEQPFEIRVYCPDIPVDVPSILFRSKHISFLPLPAHDELPQTLASCDILFLPESFEAEYRSAIELSISTKCHLYMMSGRPVLVYGPVWSGTVDYARRFGWGIVVDQRNAYHLLQRIKLATSEFSTKITVIRQDEVARTNHDIATLRKRVLARMMSIANL